MVFEILTAFLAACVVVAVLSFAADPSEGAADVIQDAWSSSVSTITAVGGGVPSTPRQDP